MQISFYEKLLDIKNAHKLWAFNDLNRNECSINEYANTDGNSNTNAW